MEAECSVAIVAYHVQGSLLFCELIVTVRASYIALVGRLVQIVGITLLQYLPHNRIVKRGHFLLILLGRSLV